jgi:hypothetical protein
MCDNCKGCGEEKEEAEQEAEQAANWPEAVSAIAGWIAVAFMLYSIAQCTMVVGIHK